MNQKTTNLFVLCDSFRPDVSWKYEQRTPLSKPLQHEVTKTHLFSRSFPTSSSACEVSCVIIRHSRATCGYVVAQVKRFICAGLARVSLATGSGSWTVEADSGNGYAPGWGMLLMMMMMGLACWRIAWTPALWQKCCWRHCVYASVALCNWILALSPHLLIASVT